MAFIITTGKGDYIMTKKDEYLYYYRYYSQLVCKLMEAKLALVDGGVKSYTIDDRTLTRFDIDTLSKELDGAIKKKNEYYALLNGRSVRKAVGIIPRDT